MKATHWAHTDDPEQWMDDPDKTLEGAAERFLVWEDDAAWDHRISLRPARRWLSRLGAHSTLKSLTPELT